MYDLQSRWKLEGKYIKYYGLRNKEHLFQNTVRLNKKQQNIIQKLPCTLTTEEQQILRTFLGNQIVLTAQRKYIPKSLDEATFCKTCVANDFIIPGLEFDGDGKCPMCQTKKETEKLKSVVPIMNSFPRSKKSRFDVAVFYTGGKDSTYLLYYLSKIQKLRVVALTWEIPYMSESARRSIEGAKRTLDGVEFITRKVSNEDLRKMYKKLYALSGNTCACPSLAYVLFYPELVANKVPYFIAGNEPAQLLGLYYNNMSPKFVYTFPENKFLNALLGVGRVLTLHPPLKKGQLHTLMTMKHLAKGDTFFKKAVGYKNTLVSNVVKAIHEVPHMVEPLKKAIRRSSWSGNIPAFVQVDLNDVCGGKYNWREIKTTLEQECGWVAPDEAVKGLHTSCQIERCKEYSQFKRFYDMQSDMIAFSALEISLASRDGNVTREEAMAELKQELGFSLQEIPECAIMKGYLEE